VVSKKNLLLVFGGFGALFILIILVIAGIVIFFHFSTPYQKDYVCPDGKIVSDASDCGATTKNTNPGVECVGTPKNYCDGSVLYFGATCQSGQWIYQTEYCTYGCENGACKHQSCPLSCDDGNPCTVDYCSESTSYACFHDPLNGAQRGCSGNAGNCKRYVCKNGGCITENLIPCCGNSICEEGETFSTCSKDCYPKLNVMIEGCDKDYDISHGFLEVTNVYVTIQNIGNADAKQVYAVASATDEEKQHPDKDLVLGDIPYGYQRTIKLTVDTKAKTETGITINVRTSGGQTATQSTNICSQLSEETKDNLEKLIRSGLMLTG